MSASHLPSASGRTGRTVAAPSVSLTRLCRELVEAAWTRARSVAPLPPRSAAAMREPDDAEQTLSEAWAGVSAALRKPGSPTLIAALLDALESIRHAEQVLASERILHRETVLGRLDEVLADLDDGDSVEQLIRNAADSVIRLGFDRVIVSAVRERHWVPEWVADERDEAWGEEILQIGRTNPRVLDGRLVESQLLARTPGIIVGDVQAEARVHHALVQAARTASYVAVPLTVNGVVTGFLHADCYYQRRNLDEIDTSTLSIFAAALTRAIHHNVVAEELEETRSGLRQLSRSVPAFSDEHPLTSRTRAVARDDSWPANRDVPLAFRSLSRRELEVMRLIAEGRTNAAIGRRLFISEGTVKSHVTNVLRKLDASSRSEVVARWFNGMG